MMDWYKSLSAREQKLALFVGSLLPIAILAYVGFWFLDRYNENSIQITGLVSQISAEEDKFHQGLKARRRQSYYRSTSLPSVTQTAKNDYRTWLNKLVSDSGMTHNGTSIRDDDQIKYEGNLVGKSIRFTVRPKATLPQLVSFLNEYYRADHLHRLNQLVIKPLRKKAPGGKMVLTGELQLTLESEVLSLVDGPESVDQFPVYTNDSRSVEEFQLVLERNIFGPANNQPVLEKPRKREFYVGNEGKVKLRAKDVDRDDLLSFELLDSSVQSASLSEQPKSASVRDITLTIPPQEKGKYDFKVLVRDDGLPAKTFELPFEISFVEKPVSNKKGNTKPPDPPAKVATQTYVNGLVQGVDGVRKALIVTRSPKLESMYLKAGDKFDLDDQKWVVRSIDGSTVTIEVDGKLLRFERGSKLSEPLL